MKFAIHDLEFSSDERRQSNSRNEVLLTPIYRDHHTVFDPLDIPVRKDPAE